VFQDAFTGANAQARDGRILLGEVPSAFPVALLVGKSARRSDSRRV
jgi:hypothetical protein